MTIADDLKAGGFSDDEIGTYLGQQRDTLKLAGFDDHAIDNYMSGVSLPKGIPEPFLKRFAHGSLEVLKKVGQGAEEGFGNPAISPETEGDFKRLGLWNDPTKDQVSPLRTLNEAVMRPLGVGINAMSGAFNAGITGLAAGIGEAATQTGVVGEAESGRLARDLVVLGNTAAIL